MTKDLNSSIYAAAILVGTCCNIMWGIAQSNHETTQYEQGLTSVRSGKTVLRRLGLFCRLARSGSLPRKGTELSDAKGFGSRLPPLNRSVEGFGLLRDLWLLFSGCPKSGNVGCA